MGPGGYGSRCARAFWRNAFWTIATATIRTANTVVFLLSAMIMVAAILCGKSSRADEAIMTEPARGLTLRAILRQVFASGRVHEGTLYLQIAQHPSADGRPSIVTRRTYLGWHHRNIDKFWKEWHCARTAILDDCGRWRCFDGGLQSSLS